MSIGVYCLTCQVDRAAPDSAAGKKARCRACGGTLQVPAGKPGAAAAGDPRAICSTRPVPAHNSKLRSHWLLVGMATASLMAVALTTFYWFGAWSDVRGLRKRLAVVEELRQQEASAAESIRDRLAARDQFIAQTERQNSNLKASVALVEKDARDAGIAVQENAKLLTQARKHAQAAEAAVIEAKGLLIAAEQKAKKAEADLRQVKMDPD